jgi:hypothetical protein
MKINATVDDRKLQQKIDQQIREQPRQIQTVLGRTAEFLMGLIKQRTQKGKNADNISFPPYTSEYKAYRRQKGRQVNYPDLNFSGNMLSNMTQKANSKQAIIFFANKFQATKAVGNQNKRTFFAVGDKETVTLINFFAKEFKKVNKLI